MAKELRQVKEKIGLRCCPFCGSKMAVDCYIRSDCFINKGEFIPGDYLYVFRCSSNDCIFRHDGFCISGSHVDEFVNKFNQRFNDFGDIYSINVDTSCIE